MSKLKHKVWDVITVKKLGPAADEGCDCPGNCPHCGLEIA